MTPTQMRLIAIGVLACWVAASCADLVGVPADQQRRTTAGDCGGLHLTTVADSTLPADAQRFYPQVDVTICTEGR
jgi:hypothetical protein